ncbi:hypothetical protein FACS189418_6240 [Clostridia bacterium]|nr:hypothetical protein FACS189418_6240 [Clostridia bacterium]
MVKRLTMEQWEDYLVPIGDRKILGTYFCQVYGYEENWLDFLDLYQRQAKESSLCFFSSLPLPSVEEVSRFYQVVKAEVRLNQAWLAYSLEIWLPDLPNEQRIQWAEGFFWILDLLRQAGDSKDMLKNFYLKSMIWLSAFPQCLAISSLSQSKLLFVGESSKHEFCFFALLSTMGTDVLLCHFEQKSPKKLKHIPGITAQEMKMSIQAKPPLEYMGDDWTKLDKMVTIKNTPIEKTPEQAIQPKKKNIHTTVAKQAEKEIQSILYEGTGMYQKGQFAHAEPLILQSTYEEITLLWQEEARFRPGFCEDKNKVKVPVIFAKIAGIPSNHLDDYWKEIAQKLNGQTLFFPKINYVSMDKHYEGYYRQVYYQKELDLQQLKQHPDYPYEYLASSVQDYLIEKLLLLLEQKYFLVNKDISTIILDVFYQLDKIDKKILHLLQNYDFAGQIPKAVILHTADTPCAIEDAILLAFLHNLGFDLLFYVPTGYQSIENVYQCPDMALHRIGEYRFDLQVPEQLEKFLLKPKHIDCYSFLLSCNDIILCVYPDLQLE